MHAPSYQRGFTLLEILVVVALMSLLLGLFVVRLSSVSSKVLQDEVTTFSHMWKTVSSSAFNEQRFLIFVLAPQQYGFAELFLSEDEPPEIQILQGFSHQIGDGSLWYQLETEQPLDLRNTVFSDFFLEATDNMPPDAQLVFIQPNGRILPEFTLQIGNDEVQERVVVNSLGLVEPDDAQQ